MEKEYTLDTIHEFFDELAKKPNITKLYVYGAYKHECKENQRKKEIRNRYESKNCYCQAIPYIINNNIVIVEYRELSMLMGYYADVNGQTSHCIYPSFEEALLGAISIKHTGREDAAEWMVKLLK